VHGRGRLPGAQVALALALALAPWGFAAEGDAVEQALAAPPVTGLLVKRVVPGSQAAHAGLEPGDILISLGGAALVDIDALHKAKEAIETEADCIVRKADGTSRTVRFSQGALGIELLAIEKGKPKTLPPATVKALDFTPVWNVERDLWYIFLLDGKTQAGFEHALMRIEDKKLITRREVAFDGGKRWGKNHFDVTVTMELRPRLRPLSIRFVSPLTSWESRGRLVTGKDRPPSWNVQLSGPEDAPPPATYALPAGLPLIPGYLVDTVACLLPRVEGSCFHFRALSDWDGKPGMATALICTGQEELEIQGERITAWKFEQRTLGGTVATTTWVDAKGRMVKGDYNGAVIVLSTKTKALAGLDKALKPRSLEEPERPR